MSDDTPHSGPYGLWRAAVDSDPARRFISFYDDTGRVELSHASTDNWVAKTANLLVDGFGTEPGDRVVLALPMHWQSLAWLLACWAAGVTAVPAGPGPLPEGDIVVAGPDRLSAALDTGAREVVGASLHPLGAPLPECPPTVVDYTTEARGHADQYVPAAPPDPDGVALEVAGTLWSARELVAAAEARAATWRLTRGDRVAIITTGAGSLLTLGVDMTWLLAPVARGAAVVLTPADDSGTLRPRLAQERVSAVISEPGRSPALADIRPLP